MENVSRDASEGSTFKYGLQSVTQWHGADARAREERKAHALAVTTDQLLPGFILQYSTLRQSM